MRLFTVTLLLGLCVNVSYAKKDFDNLTPFDTWKQDFVSRAKSQGVRQKTLDEAFMHIRRNPKVIVYDRRQPEFSRTFGQYISSALSKTRVNRAKQEYIKNKTLLDNVAKKYGVSPHYLVAFWGLETNFGSYTGKMDIIRSLATLSHDLRRAGFFEKELILALKIIQDGHAKSSSFQGSWAGAFGQTQFMPSTFTAYAVDGDGDGKKDLWGSKLDIFSSSSNFLAKVGWKRSEDWGQEVKINNPNFSWNLSGHQVRKTLVEWKKIGVEGIDGKPLDVNINGKASLILPAGANGPKFLVYTNFRKILIWNRSDYYALAVGLLANKIIGVQDMTWKPRKGENLCYAKILWIFRCSYKVKAFMILLLMEFLVQVLVMH